MNARAPADLKNALQQLMNLLQRGEDAAAMAFAARARHDFPVAHELIRLHGIALIRCGRHDEARMALNRAAELAPHSVETQCNLATLALEQGQVEASIERLRAALRRTPGHPALLHGLGTALMAAARFEQAREAFATAVRGAPGHPGLRLNLAAAELELGHPAQAEAHVREALQSAPGMETAHALLGYALRAQDRPAEAAEAWLQAERAAPGNAIHPYEAGLMLDEAGRLDDAIAAWKRALAIDPGLVPALSQLLFARRRRCDWRDLDALSARLRQAVADRRPGASPFAFLVEDADAAAQHLCAATHAAVIGHRTAPLQHPFGPAPAAPAPGAPIRVGFVSDGFGEHATGLRLVALLEALAGSGLELHLFATTPDDGSPVRRRLAAAATLHELSGPGLLPSARRIRDAGIEVLFDLDGYGGKDNAELMSLRPAPVQVNWLAGPGTSGAPWMDYLLADAVALPDALRPHVGEKLLRLPRCHLPSDPARVPAAPPTRAYCGLPEQGTVFACFGHACKLGPATFARFMLVLQQVPGSVLWLLSGPDGANGRLRAAAAALDVAPERLVFLPQLPHADYLACLGLADLFLDTLPCNAHASASDALWAGCPVLTWRGDTFAGRTTASLLHHLGLPELVAEDEDGFIATAVQLGNNRLARVALRHYLAQQRGISPLFDMQGCARDFHRAVQWISTRHRIGRPPADCDFQAIPET